MSKIDKKFIVGLLDFMKNTYRNTKSPDNPKELSLHTLHLHQSTLVRMLNAAVKEGVMDKNPFYALGRHERISKQQSEREYLTREELLGANRGSDNQRDNQTGIPVLLLYRTAV